ncbi:hypothetical protein PMI06_010020 [Burkholderia sp. BT03]|nr:hypothetical protein PMI06_010020 [Burkholderia sp. BT03]
MLIHAPCRCWKRRDSQAFDFVVASEESSTSGFGARSRTRPIGSTTFGSCCSSSNQKRLLRLPCPTRVAANIDAAHGDAGRATDPLRHSNTRLKNSWPSNRGNGGEATNVRALCGQMPDVTLSSAPGRFKPLKTARVTMFGHTLSCGWRYVCVELTHDSEQLALFFLRHGDGCWRVFPSPLRRSRR